MEPDLDVVQRLSRATCVELHRRALESGYLVRPKHDPGSYQFDRVFPILYAALAADVIQEKADG